MRVGITGHNGFIGYFLKTYLEFFTDMTPVEKTPSDDFTDVDFVVHLAEKNRGDSNEVYRNNRTTCKQLIRALKDTDTRLIYGSSIHYEDDDIFGLYRRENENEFLENLKDPMIIRIPNVFGPFCKPNYNSFVATFCHSLINEESIDVSDSEVTLIYVENLVERITSMIEDYDIYGPVHTFSGDVNTTVQRVYKKLIEFKQSYLEKLTVPDLSDSFDLNLFNTFRSYLSKDQRLFRVKDFIDDRGRLSELAKSKGQSQVFYSTTKPGIVRGEHFHTSKIERFCVIGGTASIKIRRLGFKEIDEYVVSHEDFSVIDMPVYCTHNIKNVGTDELFCVFWMDQIIYDGKDGDTFHLKV